MNVAMAAHTPLPGSLKTITLDSFQSNFFDELLSLGTHLDVHTITFKSIWLEDMEGAGKLLKTLGPSLKHLKLGDIRFNHRPPYYSLEGQHFSIC